MKRTGTILFEKTNQSEIKVKTQHLKSTHGLVIEAKQIILF